MMIKTGSRNDEADREFAHQKGIPDSDRYGQDLISLSNIVLPGYVQKLIDRNLPRNETVKNLKQELKLAGITDSLSKRDISKVVEKYRSGQPNPEYIQKLRPPSPINYSEEPLDEEEAEEGYEDEPISEEEVIDPDYYPGMEEEEEETEVIPGPEPGRYAGDDLPELHPMRAHNSD